MQNTIINCAVVICRGDVMQQIAMHVMSKELGRAPLVCRLPDQEMAVEIGPLGSTGAGDTLPYREWAQSRRYAIVEATRTLFKEVPRG